MRIRAGSGYGVHIEIFFRIAAASSARTRTPDFAGLAIDARTFAAFGFSRFPVHAILLCRLQRTRRAAAPFPATIR
jgi:hypothetical protein